jgi:uncharacterized membrane protein (DUF4010 family)
MKDSPVETFVKFPADAVAIKIAIALAIGMLVGFERESANKDAGTRTFGLTALLGTTSVLLSPGYALTAMIGVTVLMALLNLRSILVNRSLEITTSVSLLVTFTLGALVGTGHTFTPVASAILMTLLLAWKVELQRFAGGVSIEELRGAVLLGLIGLVIYPTLPNRFVDRWELVNPRQAWITVIAIAGIGFANYVLLRLYSTRGLYWSAALGGLVNSSAAAVELTRVSAGSQIVPLLLLTTTAMFVRNLIVLALFAPQSLHTAVAPLLAMAFAALFTLLRRHGGDGAPEVAIKLSSPISLLRVMRFGALFIAMQAAATLAQRLLGDYGFMIVTAVSGLVSSASATAAAATLSAAGKVSPELAGTAAVLASMASAFINLPLVAKHLPRSTLLFRLAVATTVQTVIGIAVLGAQHFAPAFLRFAR